MQQYKFTSTSYWSWGVTREDKDYLEINAPVSVDSIVHRLPKLKAISFKFNSNKFKKEKNHVAYLREVLAKTTVELVTITGSEQLTELPSEILKHPLVHFGIKQCPNFKNLEALGKMMELQHANFSGQQIALPATFFKLPILEKLTIDAEEVSNLELLPKLHQLKTLNLSRLTINQLPDGIENLDKLEYINIYNLPNLAQFPSIKNWQKLEEFHLLSLPKISELPNEFTYLKRLKKLSFNQLGETQNSFNIPKSVGQIPSLNSLNFTSLTTKKLIDFAPNNSIKDLTINMLPIKSLPDSFSNLTELNNLTLYYCHELTDISNIRFLSNLQRLRLESCPEITNLNFTFKELPELVTINFSKLEKLEKLPEFGFENSILKNISINQLTDFKISPNVLTKGINLGKESGLKSIIISHLPALKILPASLSKCLHLEKLSINNSNISTVPKSFIQLKNLEILEIINAPNFKYFPSELFPIGSKKLLIYAPHILDGSKLDIPKMVKHIRENLPVAFHQTLAFWLFNNFENEPLTEEIKKQTLEALSQVSTNMRILLMKNLYRLNPNALPLAKQPIKSGDKITIIGSTQNKRTLLRQQMEELRFVYSARLKSDVRFVLLAKKPKIATDFWTTERVLFSETEFMDFQKIENPGFLQEDNTPPEFIDNLRRLLWSDDPANEKIALEMVRNNGLPEALHMDFLVVAKTSKDKTLRNDVRKFLKGNLEESGLKILNDRSILTKKFPPFYSFVKYAPEPTIALIVGAMYHRFGTFLPNFFQYDDGSCPYRQEMVDALIPTLLKRPKYVSCAYGLLEKEANQLLANSIFDGQLNRLVLTSKLFKSIPSGVFKHQSIKILQLAVNEQAEKIVPSSIGDLFKLTTLDLRWSNLETLPPEIGKLTRLKNLTIWSNQPIQLPEEFIKLKKLTSLRISLTEADQKLWQEKMPWCKF